MINYNLISNQFEGVKLVGYVPPLDGGAIESGVTIANGFDIGQHSISQIESMFDEDLADKLMMYCGVTGYDAVKLLEKEPLKVTQEECEIIASQSHKAADEALLADWSRDANEPFHSLPDEMQTVIASVAYQYGDLPSRCPNFWRQAINQDWYGMLKNLWNFGDAFETRRRQEYMILLWGMTK